MDRQAIRFIEMLDSEERDEEGSLLISMEMRFKAFDKGQEWLLKRQKLRPAKEETEGDGIRDMRAWINDPTAAEALDQLMFQRGFVKEPPKRNGRPPKGDIPMRERYRSYKDSLTAEADALDDSGWQKELGGEA